jgi:hypothetical protein
MTLTRAYIYGKKLRSLYRVGNGEDTLRTEGARTGKRQKLGRMKGTKKRDTRSIPSQVDSQEEESPVRHERNMSDR